MYDEHPVDVHLRKIEETAARIENDLGILRREVRLLSEHSPEALGTLDAKEHTPSPLVLDEVIDPAYRLNASNAATTVVPQKLTREFKPSKFGYTEKMFVIDYGTDVNPQEVLESFLSWYISKGDRSRNWLEKFWNYSRGAVQRVKDGQTRGEFDWIDAAEEHARQIAEFEATLDKAEPVELTVTAEAGERVGNED